MASSSSGRSEFKEALRYLWHILVTAALFSFLILAAVGIEILLGIIRESRYASDFLLQTLVIGKYAILIIDLGLLA
uniref:Uncharacterized protein n=1 Tax=Candidatus Kentrum sp. MB TaxID=2138164 RepID=A0A450X2F1_9GAMM|nr:MAG: hypothetical protein BECKMB1821G_GA0114241_10057 [Candidatus Kentron sp. MB]VFK27853.1 MAG: hypothetical protein BECKMB1821I_GA0114274_10057 [Candidatus Kentron sp. MB]VFK74442.1 MAG: hypothetical protein BECKMB1821H_GA0114242_10057 [Candidatus Kentron sp. MB]